MIFFISNQPIMARPAWTQPDDKAIKATVMNQSGNLHPSNFQPWRWRLPDPCRGRMISPAMQLPNGIVILARNLNQPIGRDQRVPASGSPVRPRAKSWGWQTIRLRR